MATTLEIKPTEETLKKKLLSRQKELEQGRYTAEQVWQDIVTHVIPRLWDILNTAHSTSHKYAANTDRHKKYGEDTYDGSPQGMLQLLADGLHGYLVSPAIKWFRLAMAEVISSQMGSRVMASYATMGMRLDEIPEVRSWLQICEEVMYSIYGASNFYDSMAEYFLHGGSIGTANMWVEEDMRRQLPVFTVLHPKEAYVDVDKYGRVDTLFRKFNYTARQIMQRCYDPNMPPGQRDPLAWDPSKLTDNVVQAINNNQSSNEYEIIHCIFPRTDRNINLPTGPNKPWASVWLLNAGGGDEDDTILNEWGFDQFPTASWRWKIDTGRVYGTSPAWDALVDILGAQVIEKTSQAIANRTAYPPVMLPNEMFGKGRLNAKGVNYYKNEKRLIYPVDYGSNAYPYTMEHIERKREIIKEHFKVDFFLLLTRAERQLTATEVIERQGEKAAVLGTTIGRLNSEALNPITDLVFEMLRRQRKIPDPPQVLVDYAMATGKGKIDIEYLGPLAQAQRRLFSHQGVMRSIESAIPIMEIDPNTKDNIDWDGTIKEVMRIGGMPQELLNSKDTVMKIREARQAAAEREMQRQTMAEGASMVKDVAQADAATEGNLGQALIDNPGVEQLLLQQGGAA